MAGRSVELGVLNTRPVRRSKPEPPPKNPALRIAEIRALIDAYGAAPGRLITRAAIAELLIERELPWLLAQLEKAAV